MKLYIFIPSEHWNYCGGAIIISATSFEEALKTFSLFKLKEAEVKYTQYPYNEMFKSIKEVHDDIMSDYHFHLEDDKEFEYDHWILHRIIDCSLRENEVILENWHYA